VGKFQDTRTNIESKRIGNRAALGDQRHGRVRIVSLRDQNGRAHRHAAVTSARAMGVDFAPTADGLEGGSRAMDQLVDRDGEEGAVNRPQPEQVDGSRVRVGHGTMLEAHVDDQTHAQVAQARVIIHGGGGADEEVGSDGGKVHAGHLTANAKFYVKVGGVGKLKVEGQKSKVGGGMAEKQKPEKAKAVSSSMKAGRDIIDIDVTGSGNTVSVYIGGEKREMRTGWFFGHRYGDLATFTGRATELNMLDEWLANDTDNLLLMTAFGGFGKSALAWTWFNRVDREQWQTAVWWSFYEKGSGFESFLSETLKHLGVEVKESARQQVNDLLEAMRGTNILIVLDGFERLLRQYGGMDAALVSDDEDADIDPSQRDCSSPLTETFLRGLSGAGIKSKVLMTTRLCPRALESADGKLLKGCRDESLSAFSPEDAAMYFRKEGITAKARIEIETVCAAYGYHPLSLSLLVGLINESHEHHGDIEAVKDLEIFNDVKARRHHVLERAYESLASERRDLLSKISCFRGSMKYAVLKKVFPSPDLDKALLDLRKRGLLQYAGETQRYDMHPIVRHYAYDKFAAPDKTDAHTRLVSYFEAVPKPQKINTLEDLAPVIELYHHMVRAGNLDEAWKLYQDRLHNTLYYQFGAYQLIIELTRASFLDGKDNPPRLKERSAKAWALNALATAYALSGQPRSAVPLFEMQIAIRERQGVKKSVAIGLGNVAYSQRSIGALSVAERNLHRQIDLCREITDEELEGLGCYERGRVLSYTGQWEESEKALNAGEELKKKARNIQAQGIICSYRALRFLLMAREEAIFDIRESKFEYRISAIKSARRALELADEDTKQRCTHPSDYVRAYWLLGSAYRANNELTLAEENLSKALNLCRQINMVDHEADILLDLARLRYAQGDFKDAQEKASEALVITERSGYVLQGADVNLFLAQYALEQEKDKAKAKAYAETALKLATCDGPPYYYKVAYEEAERMLERLK
jgi:tetratricopeptide (TPR) repeat protein